MGLRLGNVIIIHIVSTYKVPLLSIRIRHRSRNVAHIEASFHEMLRRVNRCWLHKLSEWAFSEPIPCFGDSQLLSPSVIYVVSIVLGIILFIGALALYSVL